MDKIQENTRRELKTISKYFSKKNVTISLQSRIQNYLEYINIEE